jgi:ketosteroid isomerase-like protein
MYTPREVFEQLVACMTNKEWDRLPELFAEDAVVVHPFSTGPDARVEGREKVREYANRMAGFDVTVSFDEIVVHETTDPEVIICEQTLRGTFGGVERTSPGIRVMRIRDGLIVSSRDYGERQ